MIYISKRILPLLAFVPFFLSSGCVYNVEEELYPPTTCDTLDRSYQNDILPVLDRSCLGCHDAANNQGGVNLEGYDQVKIYVQNGELLGAIKHEAGFSAMPQNADKLPDCDIDEIEAWINDGAPNN